MHDIVWQRINNIPPPRVLQSILFMCPLLYRFRFISWSEKIWETKRLKVPGQQSPKRSGQIWYRWIAPTDQTGSLQSCNRKYSTWDTPYRQIVYKITQQDPRLSSSKVRRAARVAASKTSSTPSPVRDEHSRYFLAPICVAVSLPSLEDTNRSDFFLISSMARGSSRRSFFRPTNMIGTLGQRSLASSIHCCWGQWLSDRTEREKQAPTLCFTFSKESGVSTANAIRRTWAFEYARGRNLS